MGVLPAIPTLPGWQWGGFLEAHTGGLALGLVVLAIGLAALFSVAVAVMKGREWGRFYPAFLVVFVLAAVSYILEKEKSVSAYDIPYAFWALALGMLISNTVGTPGWLKSGVQTEFYIKTGLVLLGAEILVDKILAFSGYGLAIAWGVTPIVIVFMWLFGTRFLKMLNKPLVITIATATSVCGVSAAIAAAAASRAKKEDLTVAVGMSLIFTVLMMIAMPALITAIGMSPTLGGAWMGGTIDATGAVVAAGVALGKEGEAVAAIVKMIQNVLIGIVAFGIAVFWVTSVERDSSGARPSLMEVWYRLPKFILGFMAASIIASIVNASGDGSAFLDGVLAQTKSFRGWFFGLAFVSIGLESNLRDLAKQMSGGKPIVLYVVGQTFNLILTLAVAWLVLSGVLFPEPPLLAAP
ncbi:MAG: putative sulfate exporter family transporter [Candidatus Hydrogenedentes bacterium]|nr:putative sulfate exporter family transporter [Candidatus Hydrogenedentota bacterium]